MGETHLEKTCDFCCELNGTGDHLFGELVGDHVRSRIVLERGNLRAFPSLGEITAGHLLVVPTYHVTSMLGLEPADKPDASALIDQICQTYIRKFGEQPVLFEHGDPTGRDIFGGQCISHAHLHILPKWVDLLGAVSREQKLLGTTSVDDLELVTDEPYIAVGDSERRLKVFSTKDVPRQYLRALYGRLIGNDGAESWLERSSGSQTLTSIETLRKIFALETGE